MMIYGEHLRLIGPNGLLPAGRVTEPARSKKFGLYPRLSVARVQEAVDSGATLVIDGVDRLDGLLWTAIRDIEAALGETTQANIYFTPSGNCGFSAHYDTHEVFVLQLEGQKKWRLGPVVTPPPLEIQPSIGLTPPPLTQVLTLEPGDLLYVPRGQWHAAATGQTSSLHLTLAVRCFTGWDAMQLLLKASLQEPSLCRNVRVQSGERNGVDSTRSDRLREVLQALTGSVNSETIRDEADTVSSIGLSLK
jgi:ribosomal protein L16 Arg81 hydroxylase